MFTPILIYSKNKQLCTEEIKQAFHSNHSQSLLAMCEILPIDHLNFDNTTWTFQLNKIMYQLKHGAFSSEMLQQFLYSKHEDQKHPYTLFGIGSLKDETNAQLEQDDYCILLKHTENKKHAFLVHAKDFKNEFIPYQTFFTC